MVHVHNVTVYTVQYALGTFNFPLGGKIIIEIDVAHTEPGLTACIQSENSYFRRDKLYTYSIPGAFQNRGKIKYRKMWATCLFLE
jgi:hypothetical protein